MVEPLQARHLPEERGGAAFALSGWLTFLEKQGIIQAEETVLPGREELLTGDIGTAVASFRVVQDKWLKDAQ